MNQSFFKIDPMHEKKDFLRKAWISLAKEDIPLDVFKEDFCEVTKEDYHLLCTGADYDFSWSGEIGHYRTEYYVDFEKYYEQIPYTAYEKTYDSESKSYYQKPVTKYRKEERQRQVQKQRTVTDWHSGSGNHSGTATSWECIDPRGTFSKHRYDTDIKKDYFVALKPEELANAPDMVITDAMQDRADDLRIESAEKNLRSVLPGDIAKNITYQTNSYIPTYASLFKFPEYSASIIYQGKTYVKRAFAFGGMTMNQVEIPNPISVEEEKKRINQDRDKKIEEQFEIIKKNSWNKVFPFYLLSISLLALSIIMSLFVNYFFPVILCFALAIGMFVFTKKIVKKVKANATEEFNKETQNLNAIYKEKLDNYNDDHNAEIFKVLNDKLVSLGFEPANESEFYNV